MAEFEIAFGVVKKIADHFGFVFPNDPINEINVKLDIVLQKHFKTAVDHLKLAMNSFSFKKYTDAYEDFKTVFKEATLAYNSVKVEIKEFGNFALTGIFFLFADF